MWQWSGMERGGAARGWYWKVLKKKEEEEEKEKGREEEGRRGGEKEEGRKKKTEGKLKEKGVKQKQADAESKLNSKMIG